MKSECTPCSLTCRMCGSACDRADYPLVDPICQECFDILDESCDLPAWVAAGGTFTGIRLYIEGLICAEDNPTREETNKAITCRTCGELLEECECAWRKDSVTANCHCHNQRKPCNYHEGYDDGYEKAREDLGL